MPRSTPTLSAKKKEKGRESLTIFNSTGRHSQKSSLNRIPAGENPEHQNQIQDESDHHVGPLSRN